ERQQAPTVAHEDYILAGRVVISANIEVIVVSEAGIARKIGGPVIRQCAGRAGVRVRIRIALNVLRHLADAVRGDDVSRKRLACRWINDGSGQSGAEITRFPRGQRNTFHDGIGSSLTRAFVIAEDEKPVLLDGSAKRRGVVVVHTERYHGAEEVARIQGTAVV